MKQQTLVVFEQIPRVREDDAVAHLARGTRGVMVDRRLQDLLDRDKVGKLGGGGKDGVKDSTCELGALPIQAAKYDFRHLDDLGLYSFLQIGTMKKLESSKGNVICCCVMTKTFSTLSMSYSTCTDARPISSNFFVSSI